VVLDLRTATARLAIDRMGIHSLAYARTPDGLVFATSLDALRRHPWVAARVGPGGIYRYALNTVSPAPRTIYDDCEKLLPGHVLQYGGAAAEGQRRYWAPAYGAAGRRRRRELETELFERLRTAVDRAAGDAAGLRRGAFLSGGLDSSVVAGLLQEREPAPLPAFTITFDDPRYDERAYARSAATRFGLAHREYALSPDDVAGMIPELNRAFDEPFGNSSVIPAHACARMARDAGVDLLVAGDGGDEIFAGNKRYVEQRILGLYDRLPALARLALGAAVRAAPATGKSLPAKARRFVRRARMPMPERMLNPTVFRRDALAAIFEPDALAEIDVDEPYRIWQQHYDAAGTGEPLYAMQHLDLRMALADNDLRKVGRACDMAGVRVAYPMLDPDLVAFAAAIPADKLIRGLELRHFFKRAMRDFLPPDVLAKRKQGFAMPFPAWTRSDARLRDMVDDAIDGLKARGVFRPAFLDTARAAHRQGAGSVYDAIIYDLLMLEGWQRERERPSAARGAVDPARWVAAS
jgi:asparagine synthase (glutamine-hydrolysing)